MVRLGDAVRAFALIVLTCALPAAAQQVRILSETYSTWGEITYPNFPGENRFTGSGPSLRGTITRDDEYYLTHLELDAYRNDTVVFTGLQAYTDWVGLEDYHPVFSGVAMSSLEFLIEDTQGARLSIQTGTDAGSWSWELVNLETGWSLPDPGSWWDGHMKRGLYRFTAVARTENSRATGGDYVSLSFPGAQVAVPEPAAALLLMCGAASVVLRRTRRRA